MVIFSLFSVSGQTCGQTTYIGNFIQLFTADLCSVFKGIRRFWNFYARNWWFAPEPSALPSCATPRDQVIIAQSVAPVKRRRAKFTIKKQVRRRRAQRTGKMPVLFAIGSITWNREHCKHNDLKNSRKNGIMDSGKNNCHYETQKFISCLLLFAICEAITTTYREIVEFIFPLLYNVTAERRE